LKSNVTKRFGDFAAVDDVNLDVPHGTFVCLLGPSGCGKTTLLRMIAGLEEPSEGAILLDGSDITGGADAQARFRHGVPVAGAVSAPDRRRQHRLPAAHPRPARARSRRAASTNC
jgi:ABC-type Fe3+/spermidine/putrescine transport system ATPase subunit